MNKNNLPTNAIVAVTLNCNSRCIMCDIWKNKTKNELKPKEFSKLPSTLTDINLTGGEPFLRPDIDKIVFYIKKACPKAQLILNTNGFLTSVIKQQIPKILKHDPNFAVRISLDGWKNTHNKIRRTPQAFKKALSSLSLLKKLKVKNLGISFTIMEQNYQELPKIYRFTKKNNLQFSLTLATNSQIYFGKNKQSLRPKNLKSFKEKIKKITLSRFKSLKPKGWFRAWFELELLKYYQTNKRPFPCNAASDFFYLDSTGNIYPCHISHSLLGNIRKQNFKKIWNSNLTKKQQLLSKNCHQCWMTCTAKTNIKKNIFNISKKIIKLKIQAHLCQKN